MTERYTRTFSSFSDGAAWVEIGGEQLGILSAAHAAVKLAVVERVRVKCLDRAEREANLALRERYGLPDDR
jgi:hypothetical protein